MVANRFAHLGPAPYRFAGMECAEDRLQSAQAAAEKQGFSLVGILDNHKPKCGTSCDHCGTCIENVFHFQAANGAKFKIGETCANKILYPEQSSEDYATRAAAHQAKAKMAKAKTARKKRMDAVKIARGIEFVDANAAALAALPHGNKWRAEKGETLADSIAWMLAHSGTTGKLKTLRGAYKALGQKMPRVTSAELV